MLACLLICCQGNSQRLVHSDIKLDFAFKRVLGTDSVIAVTAWLYNPGPDTVYFLEVNCSGVLSGLRYDTSAVQLESSIPCCRVSSLKQKIVPGTKFEFDVITRLKIRGNQKTIQLGFDLYRVNRSFDAEYSSVDLLKILKRKPKRQYVIWAEVKNLE